ncbi:SDR family NAD(P)-dependent oxidoreductase [Oceanobacillus halophilus]|uniref:SDR family oxidoreductase n=1 Tax=Oceanobacillus halophilus TaxID=930130 RepID=A0A495A7F0_9BACI|nr:SDR family oxidoreductase [Oceanobacillus halophilus]RKQ35653.1 SDR family oxidoreductase [Oceanobacillus halophilus]
MSLFSKDALVGKHALITGATGGIGYETAKVLAGMGAAITITGRREEVLQQLKEEILNENSDAKVLVVSADLTNSAELDQLVEAAESANGFVSHLVNSAGVLGNSAIVEDMTIEQLEKVMHVNYTVPILLTKKIYSTMKDRKEGSVVNVASLSGLRGTYGGTAYCGSKFALIGFTQSFALEAIQHGVRVNAVCPGYVETEMGKESIRKKGIKEGRSFEEQYTVANKSIPSGRISSPEEVANTIAFLLTDAAANIVGESVKISGGSVMR